jgi:Putative MetA-pathway of phenol degradation
VLVLSATWTLARGLLRPVGGGIRHATRRHLAGIVAAITSKAQEARADEHRFYLGGTLAVKGDGIDGPGSNANPAANMLGYLPVGIEAGYELAPYLRVRASGTAGFVAGDETSGVLAELLVGPELVLKTSWGRAGLRLDAGVTHVSYDFKDENTSFNALVVEPKLMVAFDVGSGWELGVQAGPRAKWIADQSDQNPQLGLSLGITLARYF